MADQPIGRRAANRAARAAFTAARNHGLVARHRAKLQHLAERGIDHTQRPHRTDTPQPEDDTDTAASGDPSKSETHRDPPPGVA